MRSDFSLKTYSCGKACQSPSNQETARLVPSQRVGTLLLLYERATTVFAIFYRIIAEKMY